MDRRKFTSRVLFWAAAYNLVWGGFVIAFPMLVFDWADLPRPRYPEIWQCVGMIVGVYGIGYWIASWDPVRHWPIVLVGFLGKLFGPIGFIQAMINDTFNSKFGVQILFNDLIWWIPFYLILREAFLQSEAKWKRPGVDLKKLKFSSGESVAEKSHQNPLLFILLRHAGCTFCRETLSELSKVQNKLKIKKTKAFIVHMGSEQASSDLRKAYRIDSEIEFVSDPEKKFYRSFQIPRGTLKQLFGPKVWGRGLMAGVFRGHGVGALVGDGFQLGGVYRLDQGNLEGLFVQNSAADRIPWDQLLRKIK